MRQILVTAVNETYEEQLAALRLPVELLWGAEDTRGSGVGRRACSRPVTRRGRRRETGRGARGRTSPADRVLRPPCTGRSQEMIVTR